MSKFLCGECIHNSDKGGGCLIPKNLGYVDNCNRYLPKDRPIVQTNEEWLHSLTTEQLAEFVIKAMLFYDNTGMTALEAIKNAVEDNENLSKYFIENVVEWLKQPHKDGES